MNAPRDILDLDTVLLYIGRELEDKRDELDLSRNQAVELFSEVTHGELSDRTLLAYEKARRDMTVRRLLQLCATYGASPVLVLASAIHRANTDCCPECGR